MRGPVGCREGILSPRAFQQGLPVLAMRYSTPKRFLKRRLHLFVTFGYFAYIYVIIKKQPDILFLYSCNILKLNFCFLFVRSDWSLGWRYFEERWLLILRDMKPRQSALLWCVSWGGGGFRRSGSLVMEIWLDEVAHTSNPGIWEAEARDWVEASLDYVSKVI